MGEELCRRMVVVVLRLQPAGGAGSGVCRTGFAELIAFLLLSVGVSLTPASGLHFGEYASRVCVPESNVA